ncbi:MAG: hypothetical protein QOK32_224, partial [Gaiellaceae bacterium]|nr:hypothetical protein [Gaiellaceae bacterium]
MRIEWFKRSRIPELQRFIEAEWRSGHALARDGEL